MMEIDWAQCRATRHGTMSAYCHAKCRCPDAVAAWNLYHRALRRGFRKRMTSLGSARRLRALRAIGHDLDTLAEECGHSAGSLVGVCSMRHGEILVRIARDIEEMYERLSSTPGTSIRARNQAIRLGWFPPAAWEDIDDPNEVPNIGGADHLYDEVVVRYLVAGRPVSARKPDRIEAVRRMVEQGDGTGTISARLRMNSSRLREIIADLQGAGSIAAVDQEAA